MKVQKLLTQEESKRLDQLEKTIESGRKTWIAAGEALIEIRDKELYRTAHKRFEDYVRDRWGWSRIRAYQLIDAVGVRRSLPENVNHGLQSERQARELAKVEPEHREEVVTKAAEKAASESRPMTARDVKAAAVEVCPPEPEEPEKPRVHSASPAQVKASDELAVTFEDIKIVRDLLSSGEAQYEDCMTSVQQLKKAARALEAFAAELKEK